MGDGRVHQRQRAGDVVAEEAARLAHGLAGLDEGREVQDGVERLAAQHRIQPGAVQRVAAHEAGGRGHGRQMPAGQVVVDGDAVSGLQQLLRHGAADVARAAGDENVHGYLS
ncbi:MAG: hypothetical protein V9E94_03485 [Microthrixaceae bacterium]